MLIARSTFSCATACNGNNARETLRSWKLHGDWGWTPHDNEDVSLSVSEPDSASLHHPLAAKLPNLLKSANNEEEMSKSTHCASRGDWGRRMSHVERLPGNPGRSSSTQPIRFDGSIQAHGNQ